MWKRSGAATAGAAGVQDPPCDLTPEDYECIRRLVYEKSGIHLGAHKQQLVRARLGKRLRAGHFRSYRAYFEHIRQDATGTELCHLIDAISTNTTHLFREKQHFDFLAEVLAARCREPGQRCGDFRVWSAGCSSGEEPYSIAMTVDDVVSRGGVLDWRLLATDISTRILERARAGRFEPHRLGTVPEPLRRRYFVPGGPDGLMQIVPELRARITFAHFNLMVETYPFRHGFDFIFCRNVMIYFDTPTQTRLVARFAAQLRPGGYLLIGHSESLNNIRHPLKYVRPTIYQRAEA